MTLTNYCTPFPAAPFRHSMDVNDWLRALDKAGMCFHLEDHPAYITWNDSVPFIETDQMHRLVQRWEEFREMLGEGVCPVEYASDVIGGGWRLPRADCHRHVKEGRRAVLALRLLHEEPDIEDESLIGDFLANLMHLKGREWVEARMRMADCHFEEESPNV